MAENASLKQKIRTQLRENTMLRKNFLTALPFWIGALLTGLMAVMYAKFFAVAESMAYTIYRKAGWAVFLFTPITFLLSWWLVKRFAPYSRGSGIPQVSAAIELANPKHHYKVNKLLGFRIMVVKIVSSMIGILGGAVIGREGPTIQIAASIFKKINDILPEWYPRISKQNMIITGAAAGLASAFNTPLGGIVFTIEELAKIHFNFFKSVLLTGVIIAGLTALSLSGPYLYLGYPQVSDISAGIILLILPLAIISGLAGSGMCRIILILFAQKRKFPEKKYQVLYILACGLIIAGLAYFVDERVLGSGKGIMMTTLFSEHKAVEWYVPILRIIGPILSFSSEIAGGIFAPGLSAGASMGALVAQYMHLPPNEANLMILSGMVGFLTGITKSPFTSSILVIEMTNDHNIIFHLMAAAVIANLAANTILRHSFYDYLKERYIHEIHSSETQESDPEIAAAR